MWLRSIIDSLESSRAAEDDVFKVVSRLEIDSCFAFPGTCASNISEFSEFALAASTRADFFARSNRQVEYKFSDEGVLHFVSGFQTEDQENNLVRCYVRESKKRQSAVIILPHWNATTRSYDSFARYLCMLGISAAELVLPYHGVRNGTDRRLADRFLSANLGKTVASVRQAVLDTVDLADWFFSMGYKKVGLIGVSLGSCIAGLTSAHFPRISATSLILTAGDFAEVVWTGRATRHIRRSFEQNISLEQLRMAWSIISTDTYVELLAKSDRNLLILLAERDNVVHPSISHQFISKLRSFDIEPKVINLSCGHYTLSLPPYGWIAFYHVMRLLKSAGF